MLKQHIIDALRTETRICIHLSGKLSVDHLDYRPSQRQRSTIELLRYLTNCMANGTELAMTGDIERMRARGPRNQDMSLSGFPAAMTAQLADVEARLAPLSDHDLATKPGYLRGSPPTLLGSALLGMPVRFMIGYRMQLFLYAKACGAEISTSNCWMGVDALPQQAAPKAS